MNEQFILYSAKNIPEDVFKQLTESKASIVGKVPERKKSEQACILVNNAMKYLIKKYRYNPLRQSMCKTLKKLVDICNEQNAEGIILDPMLPADNTQS